MVLAEGEADEVIQAFASDCLNQFAMTAPLIEQFADLARDYDVLLCDVWGVVHNGVAAFPQACDALARFRGARIGIVFQSFHLIPTMTALENVAIPLELSGATAPFEKARAELAAAGLRDRLSHYPAQLSGGEQQRVAIARAMAPGPAILIADEPTGNLDEATGASIIDLIFALKRDRGTTLIVVTHDHAIASKCDRRICLHSGRIAEKEAELTA